AGSARLSWRCHHSDPCGLGGRDFAGDRPDLPPGQPSVATTGCPMKDNPFSLWVYLSQSPLLWLTVTLLVYASTDAVSLATRRHPLANPVLHAMWIIGAYLLLPATVALAVPLYENRGLVLASVVPMLVALAAGSITAVVSIVLLAEAA